MGEWDSIHALAVSDFALIIKKKKERATAGIDERNVCNKSHKEDRNAHPH